MVDTVVIVTVVIVLIVLLFVFVPSLLWVVFMGVKLGTYAFFKGRALFYEEEEKANGKKS